MLQGHLEKLVHFAGVVRAGSIRNYAVRNNLSQPAVSKSLQILESALEATLLIRSRHGVTLTQSGHEVFEWAEAILAQSKNIEDNIRRRTNVKLQGELTIGTYQSIAVYFAPKFFKFIQAEARELKLHFVSATSAELLAMLRSGKLDLIVSVEPPELRELFQFKLFDDTYSLYKSAASARKLRSSPLFTVPLARDHAGKTLEAYLNEANLGDQLIACGDFEATKAMLEADAGFAVLPCQVARPLLEAKRIVAVSKSGLPESFGTHSVVFSCKSHRAADASIRWVLDQLQLMLRTNAK